MDLSKDDIDEIIKSLGVLPNIPEETPSYKNNVTFQVDNEEKDVLAITMTVRNYTHTLRAHRSYILEYLSKWMERVVIGDEDVIQCVSFDGDTLQMIPQRIGQFTQMGQFRVVNHNEEELFSAYVDRQEFIRGLNLSLMDNFGFFIS